MGTRHHVMESVTPLFAGLGCPNYDIKPVSSTTIQIHIQGQGRKGKTKMEYQNRNREGERDLGIN